MRFRSEDGRRRQRAMDRIGTFPSIRLGHLAREEILPNGKRIPFTVYGARRTRALRTGRLTFTLAGLAFSAWSVLTPILDTGTTLNPFLIVAGFTVTWVGYRTWRHEDGTRITGQHLWTYAIRFTYPHALINA
jgi:hypothetical protein